MTSNFPAPSTIGGIKRLAKQLKRQSKHLSHLAALDMASRQAKFENFKHAHRTLKTNKEYFLTSAFILLLIGMTKMSVELVERFWRPPSLSRYQS